MFRPVQRGQLVTLPGCLRFLMRSVGGGNPCSFADGAFCALYPGFSGYIILSVYLPFASTMCDLETCNLCEATEYKIIYSAGAAQTHQIVECVNCGLMYANPRGTVDVEEIVGYDPEWVLKNIDTPRTQGRIKKEQLQVRDYKDTEAFLNTRYEKKGELLEIGSGFGYLCDYFRNSGWNVTGVEPNEGLSVFANRELHINTLPNTLDEAGFADNSFDVILMMHVIEHLSDPLSTLKLVREKLRSNGMFILETPRYDTLSYRLLGKRERSVRCDGHIFFFTSKTLHDLCLKAGFKVVKTDYVGRTLSLERLMWNLGVISKSKNVAKLLEGLSRALRFDRLRYKVNLRDMQRIYLLK